jgi:hypothetical protein
LNFGVELFAEQHGEEQQGGREGGKGGHDAAAVLRGAVCEVVQNRLRVRTSD